MSNFGSIDSKLKAFSDELNDHEKFTGNKSYAEVLQKGTKNSTFNNFSANRIFASLWKKIPLIAYLVIVIFVTLRRENRNKYADISWFRR